mgnify:CR=1 FL=1
MARIVELVKPKNRPELQTKRVCAYARVSSGKDSMLHSLSAQVSYFQRYIHSHVGWKFAGVYADEALTGTKGSREQFQEMIKECKKGNIDLIVTKSISRFARNTLTLLETVRELKSIGVEVFFEEQNISTFSTDGEVMLTILASYAQEESLSVSENMRWRILKNFEQGKPWSGFLFGYKLKDGQYTIVPEEAEIVRLIYQYYLEGTGYEVIARRLNADGYKTAYGLPWNHSTVMSILKNYNYTGNLLLQKTYTTDHLTKKTMWNHGELPQYRAEETHEAIIPIEVFDRVQEEIARRAEKYKKDQPKVKQVYPFSSKLVCPYCGWTYRRKVTPYNIIWQCNSFSMKGKSACPDSKSIPNETLEKVSCEVLGMEEFDATLFREAVDYISPEKGNVLIFHMADGREIQKVWKDRSRSESWSEEKRKQFGEKLKELHRQ